MELHLFGASTPSGEAFRQLASANLPEVSLISYSRQPASEDPLAQLVDFNKPFEFHLGSQSTCPAVWISFGPIWLLAPFLEHLARKHPECLNGLCGLIACSSSSALTKRYSANPFDMQLSLRLICAEEQLLVTCRRLQVGCHILQPTLIYGQVGSYCDRNLSRLVHLMRRLPLLPLPSESGLRQPIHASQLAAVALHLAQQLFSGSRLSLPERIALGGDTTISYSSMIRALQEAQPVGDQARCCRLLFIPNRLLFLFAAPLLLCSPKAFEAVLRMGASLSGFTPAHQILGADAQPFPVLPLA